MAANTVILREFLVALGYRVDETSQRRVEDDVERVSGKILTLGKAIGGMATALAAATIKMASDFDDIYFMSKRTGESVTNIKALEFGFRNVGGTAEQAQAAIQKVSNFLKFNPQSASWLKQSLGIDAGENSPEKIIEALSASLNKMPVWQAKVYAETLGIDPDTMLLIRQNGLEIARFAEEQRKRYEAIGISQDELADKSKGFMRDVRSVWADFGVAWDAFYNHVIDAAGPALHRFAKAFDENLPQVAKHIDKLFDHPGWTFFFGGLFGPMMYDKFGKQAEAALAPGPDHGTPETVGHPGSSITGSNKPATINSRAQRAMDYFQAHGWSGAQAAGIVANLFRESGLDPSALGDDGRAQGIAQWHADRAYKFFEKFGHNMGASARPFDEQLEFVQHELTQGDERAAGDVLRRQQTAEAAARAVNAAYERPWDVFGEGAKRTALAGDLFNGAKLGGIPGSTEGPSLTQNTTIHVAGGPDPHATGRAVKSEFDRATADDVRNFFNKAR